jgi:hypothetical protein
VGSRSRSAGGTGSYTAADSSLTAPGDYELARVFGDGLSSSSATGGNYLIDLLSPFGDLPGCAAAGGNLVSADDNSLHPLASL